MLGSEEGQVESLFSWPEMPFFHDKITSHNYGNICYVEQGHSQDLETGCPKLAIIKFWAGILFFKGEHNILRLKP